MRKYVVPGGAGVVVAAALSAALLSAPIASSQSPTHQVIGLPYGEAKAMLKAMGIEASIIDKHGNDLPLAQCIVRAGDYDLSGKMGLRLNCKNEAEDE